MISFFLNKHLKVGNAQNVQRSEEKHESKQPHSNNQVWLVNNMIFVQIYPSSYKAR